jgi:predicted short-subunit dehydrogenase-like oxidoreductase (DUF2520 family)
MKIVIIGSGNVATVLGNVIKNAGHQVLQVYSRDINRAIILANKLATAPIDDLKQLNKEADIYLMALSDAVIPETVKKLHLSKGILVHTAGAVAINVLQNAATNYGVLYPLQSLRKEKLDYQNIPFLVDGSTVEVISTITAFAKTLSSSVEKADDEERLKLHLAAVIVSNFTNYLYALAEDYCKNEKVSFNMLQPLIAEVANRLQNHRAAEMQTGPAIRKDVVTIEKHLELLKNHLDLQEVYTFLSNKIMNM